MFLNIECNGNSTCYLKSSFKLVVHALTAFTSCSVLEISLKMPLAQSKMWLIDAASLTNGVLVFFLNCLFHSILMKERKGGSELAC